MRCPSRSAWRRCTRFPRRIVRALAAAARATRRGRFVAWRASASARARCRASSAACTRRATARLSIRPWDASTVVRSGRRRVASASVFPRRRITARASTGASESTDTALQRRGVAEGARCATKSPSKTLRRTTAPTGATKTLATAAASGIAEVAPSASEHTSFARSRRPTGRRYASSHREDMRGAPRATKKCFIPRFADLLTMLEATHKGRCFVRKNLLAYDDVRENGDCHSFCAYQLTKVS
mmetsp:Transcript_21826/g.46139  ORF Transcript_21826/g.46139 Transcript_21826/m.46139 type:complete len:242 (+) Transcript_21826:495-1220(+)